MPWTRVAQVCDVPDGECKAIEVDGVHIAVVRVGGRLYALSNICTHQFAFMSEGCIDGEYIECPMHQGRFHIPTGTAQGAPVSKPLKTYPVRCEGDAVLVDITPDA
jgi:nitrite reductase/ring-hydroxylating ferredoxin subunit